MSFGFGCGVGMLGGYRGGTPAPTPTPTPTPTRLMTWYMSDQDSAAGEERDDNTMFMLALATQDIAEICGICSDAPDGLASSYTAMAAAYGQDRAGLIANSGGDASDFLTEAELLARVYQGPTTDSPSAGYRTPSPTSSARKFIDFVKANGQVEGTPITNPYGKVWVINAGGYTNLAQACREAVALGEDPDFLKRIAVINWPQYNAAVGSPNAWAYIMNNCYQSDGVPGLFGDLWMLHGVQMLSWYAQPFTDSVWFRDMIPGSAMGRYIDGIRANSGYTTENMRSGDCGLLTWVLAAIAAGNFNPTDASNDFGVFTLADEGGPGDEWTLSNNMPSQKPLYSPSNYFPLPGVNAGAANTTPVSIAGMDQQALRDMLASYFRRYSGFGLSDTSVLADDFAGAGSNTNLSAWALNQGGTLSLAPGGTSERVRVSPSGYAEVFAGSGSSFYLNDTNLNANCYAELDFTHGAGDTGTFSLILRANPDGNSFYTCRFSGSNTRWEIYRRIGGSNTLIWNSGTIALPVDFSMRFEALNYDAEGGSNNYVILNLEAGGSRYTIKDSNASRITGAGRVGILAYSVASTPNIHATRFEAGNL